MCHFNFYAKDRSSNYTRTYIQFSILLHQYYSPKSDHFSQENKISLPLQGTEDTFPLKILESPNSRSPPSLRIKKKKEETREQVVRGREGSIAWKEKSDGKSKPGRYDEQQYFLRG